MRLWIAKLFLKLMGWAPEGVAPEHPKFVLIAAPHTSNWDFPLLLALGVVFGVKVSWVGKHTLFRPPFGRLMRALGGISVDRRRSGNMVQQIAETLRRADRLALTIPAEGTRGYVDYWKSGFYHVAREADVPIVCGYLDYRTRRGGFGGSFTPTGDVRADMDRVRAFYADKTARYPKLFGRVRLKEEDETPRDPGEAPSSKPEDR